MQSNCLNCQTLFIAKSGSTGKFCSSSCSAKFNNKKRGKQSPEHVLKRTQKRIETISNGFYQAARPFVSITYTHCTNCDKLMAARINRVRKTCSKECRDQRRSYCGKQLAQAISNRSKAEDALYQLCLTLPTSVFPNYIIQDGWDADIVMPDIKLAIAWNGPWHYKEIVGLTHSLKQVQNRDRIKQKLFEQLGWTFVIFEDRYFTPETAFDVVKKMVGPTGFEPVMSCDAPL